MDQSGFEPEAPDFLCAAKSQRYFVPRVQGRCSTRLSYWPKSVALIVLVFLSLFFLFNF